MKKQKKKESNYPFEGTKTRTGGTLGKPVTKVEHIHKLAQRGKSIWHMRLGRPVPASWLQNMPVSLIVGYFRMFWLYEYRAKSQEKAKKAR